MKHLDAGAQEILDSRHIPASDHDEGRAADQVMRLEQAMAGSREATLRFKSIRFRPIMPASVKQCRLLAQPGPSLRCA
jgi:hypothetical protein